MVMMMMMMVVPMMVMMVMGVIVIMTRLRSAPRDGDDDRGGEDREKTERHGFNSDWIRWMADQTLDGCQIVFRSVNGSIVQGLCRSS